MIAVNRGTSALRGGEGSNPFHADISIFWADTALPQRSLFKMVACGHSISLKAHWKGIYTKHRWVFGRNRGPYSGFLHRCYSHPKLKTEVLRAKNTAMF